MLENRHRVRSSGPSGEPSDTTVNDHILGCVCACTVFGDAGPMILGRSARE